MKTKVLLLPIVLIVVFSGCAPTMSIEDVCKAGQINENVYINDVLGFKATFPDEWTFATDEQTESLYQSARNIDENTMSNMEAISDNLVCCFKGDPETCTVQAPYICVVVSSSAIGPISMPDSEFEEALTGQAEVLQEILPDTDVEVRGEQNYQINQKQYSMINMICKGPDTIYYSDTYMTHVKYYIVSISASYLEEDKDTIETFMKELEYS